MLNPNRRWDSFRRTSVGRPTQADGTPKPSTSGRVRRQSLGRVGKGFSSEPEQVHASCQQASRRGMHRAGTCRSKLARLNKPAIELHARNPDKVGGGVRNVCACTEPSDETLIARLASFQKGRSVPGRPFLMERRRLGCDVGWLQHSHCLPVFAR